MGGMLFCNIGWMSRYEGLKHKPDKIVGGGKWVDENQNGGEVCNFLACSDGFVYGHVESIQGKRDRQITIEALGGTGHSVDGIDVIWTATDPKEGGRRVVGWYKNATVFRERQYWRHPPTRQHKLDELTSYRICANARDMHRLDLDHRALALGRGPGWMGQTPWWAPSGTSSEDVLKLVKQVRQLLDGSSIRNTKRAKATSILSGSPSANVDGYLRYVEAYEVEITPRHNNLQMRFEQFSSSNGVDELRPNVAHVDLWYRDPVKGVVLAEIKPCEAVNVRFAIRTAMGQLLDYRQRLREKVSLLIVLEIEPLKEDKLLATLNGFGVAYPRGGGFTILWPAE